jgi:hypothetical protein
MPARFPSVLAALLLLGCSAGKDPSESLGARPGGGGVGIDGGGLEPGLDGDPGSGTNPNGCANKDYGGRRLPLAIAVVLDTSLSMAGNPMKTAIDGLKKAFGDPRFDDVAVGLFRYGYPRGECDYDKTPTFVPAPLATSRAGLFAAIDALKAEGTTPTYSALEAAYVWVEGELRKGAAPFDGKAAVVLVTDGVPYCNARVVRPSEYGPLVAGARGKGIETFVIGLPGSGAFFDSGDERAHSTALLSVMAAQGTAPENLPAGCEANPSLATEVKKGCFIDLQTNFSVDSLSQAFDRIREAASSCVYEIPQPGPNYDVDRPGVFVKDATGQREVPRCDPTPQAGGCWEWSDGDKRRVRLVGGACGAVQADPKSTVTVSLPCRVT